MEIKLLMDWGAIIVSVLTLFGILYAASKDTKNLRRDHVDLNKDLHRDHIDILDVTKSVKSDTDNLNHHQGIIQSELTILFNERKEKNARLNGLTYEQTKVDAALSEIAAFNEIMQRTQDDNQQLLNDKRILETKVHELNRENSKLKVEIAKYRQKNNQRSHDNGFER
ncbi:hypothetical protein ACPBEH_11500 (plasmid) [Latilactobacillus sp. 5-91]|uniref:hypothetical protein n=1 Tax=Latilactobacillus sp. 5-91 TaxID=3410924 RepID=UPI0030B710CD